MITIPFEEYEELKTYKNIANDDGRIVFVKNETHSLDNHYLWWVVYTKDQAVKEITDELIQVNKELEKSRERCKQLEEENEKSSYSKRNIIINILLLCIMVALIYLMFNVDYI